MMTNNYRYRICKKCGKKWNVSVQRQSVKDYICPICEKKKVQK